MSSHVEGFIICKVWSQLLPQYIQWDWQAWWFYFKASLQMRNWDSEWFNDLIAVEGHSLAWKGRRRALQMCQWSPGWITEKGSEQLTGSGKEAEVLSPSSFIPLRHQPLLEAVPQLPQTHTLSFSLLFFPFIHTHAHPHLCPTLCDLMDCSLPGYSIHGISQARRLEWIVISFLQGVFTTQGSNSGLLGLLYWQEDSLPLSYLGSPFYRLLHLKWASLVAQLVKNLAAMWEIWVRSLGWEDPWRRQRLPTPVFWPGEFHGLYSPWSHKESDTTEQLSHTSRI